LLTSFVDQRRMKLNYKEYTPCYRIKQAKANEEEVSEA